MCISIVMLSQRSSCLIRSHWHIISDIRLVSASDIVYPVCHVHTSLATGREVLWKTPYEEMKALFRLRRQIDTDIEPLPFSRDVYSGSDSSEFVSEIVRKGKVIYMAGST